MKRVLLVLALMGCERELILPGERIDIRPPDVALREGGSAEPLPLEAPTANASWTHKNGDATHVTAHPALSQAPVRVWSVSIGRGNSREGYMTGAPVIAEGRIFVKDATALITAVSPAGAILWQTDVSQRGEAPVDGFGGGLALDGPRLFATTGMGDVVALDAATGAVLWRHEVDAPVRAAPTARDGLVIAIGRDDVAYGLDQETGRLRWRAQGARGEAGLLGGASPATDGRVAVLPFASGEVAGVLHRNGLRVWSVSVAGGRRGLARSVIGDITGDPVIAEDAIYVANQSGQTVAIQRRSGDRLWTASEGSLSPVWPAGGSVFLVSDRNRVLRLDAATGEPLWAADLPVFARPSRERGLFVHFGPVLAGGLLRVAGSDGVLRSFDPLSGAPAGTVEIPGGATSDPAVAGGTLYLLSADGRLHAYR